SISRSSFENNNGGGIRIDGHNGGFIRASISDTVSSLNAANGVIAVSGPGDVRVHITRSVIAENAQFGVESSQNAAASIVTVNSSSITSNFSGALNSVGGGALQTYGDNRIFGVLGTGFTGAIPMQ